MKVLALDFGGSSVKYGVVDDQAVISDSGRLPAPLLSVEQFVDTVEKLYLEHKNEVDGIGISLPGNIDPETGILSGSGVYTPLYGYSIKELIENRCHVSVAVENDGKCGALSEAWKGELRDCDNGAVIILGSGIAGGIIKDKKVHSGKGFNAGEFSYMIVKSDDYSMMSCGCMQIGMLGVTYKLCKLKNLDLKCQDSSPTLEYLDSILSSQFPAPDGEPKKIKADGKQFFDWINQGDEDSLRVYNEFIKSLACMIFNIQICYAPDRIVIGGGLSSEDRVITDVKDEIQKYYSSYGLDDKMKAEIVQSRYRRESNIYGATYNYLIRN